MGPDELVSPCREPLHATDVDRALFQIARAVTTGHNHTGSAIIDLAIVEQMQWLTNESGVLMVFNRDGIAHDCRRIERGVLAFGYGDRRKLTTRCAILGKIFLRDQRGTGPRRGHAV